MMNETLIPEEPPKKKFPRLGKRGKIAAGALAVVVLAALVLPRLGQGTAAAVLPYQLYQASPVPLPWSPPTPIRSQR